MSPGRNRRISFPEPDDERPPILSADGLVLGPLIEEDGTDMGTYDFRVLLPDCPRGLVVPLVAGLARGAGPGGRWRRRASVRQVAGVLRTFVREIARLYPQLDSIERLSPEMYRTWFWEVRSRVTWPGLIVIVRGLLEETDGVPRETLQAVRTLRASKPNHGASKRYTRSEFRRIRSALRRSAFAGHARVESNAAHLALYLAGEEPDDAPRWQLMDEVFSKGEFLAHLARTGRLPDAYLGAEHVEQIPVRESLGCVAGGVDARAALFPTASEAFALAALIACERGWNHASIMALDLDAVERVVGVAGRGATYRIELDKPRRGSGRRFGAQILTRRQARLWELAVAFTQPARDTLAELGHPTTQLLVAISQAAGTTGPGGVFITDWLTQSPGSLAWHRKVELAADDGTPLRVTFLRLRKTWFGMHRRPNQNTGEVLEQSYLRNDPEVVELALQEAEHGLTDWVEGAKEGMVQRIGTDDLAAARDGVRDVPGISQEQAGDILSGRLETPGCVACLDIHHSPHPADDGGDCTVSPLICLACPNAVSTPAHLPKQLALAEVLKNAAAALFRTPREGQYDLHLLRLRSLIARATPAEIEEARSAITAEDIDNAERLLRREFDVW